MLLEILLCFYILVGILIFIRVEDVIASKVQTITHKTIETIVYIIAGIITIALWPIFLGIN